MFTDDMAIVKFLDLIGWGNWFRDVILKDGALDGVTFADLVFGTLPFMLQLFLIIFLLNWVMGIIGDITKIFARGGRF